MKSKASLIALSLAMAFAAASCDSEKEEKIQWANVPAAVQKTITENAGGVKVAEVDKETKDGKTAYEAKIEKSDGKKIEIKVAEDGKLIKFKNKD